MNQNKSDAIRLSWEGNIPWTFIRAETIHSSQDGTASKSARRIFRFIFWSLAVAAPAQRQSRKSTPLGVG